MSLFDGALGKEEKIKKLPRFKEQQERACLPRSFSPAARRGVERGCGSQQPAERTADTRGRHRPGPGRGAAGAGRGGVVAGEPRGPRPRAVCGLVPRFPASWSRSRSAPLGHSCESEFGAGTARPAGPRPRQRPGRFLAQLSHPFQPSLFPGLPISPGSSRPAAPVPRGLLNPLGPGPGALDGRIASSRPCAEGAFGVTGSLRPLGV